MPNFLRWPHGLLAVVLGAAVLVVPSVLWPSPEATDGTAPSIRALSATATPAALRQLKPGASKVAKATLAPSAPANVDKLVTGSIDPGPAAAAVPQASAGFREALATLVDGDKAGAFEQARALPDVIERRTLQWAAIHYGDGAIDYRSLSEFAAETPSFARGKVFQTRLEQALTRAKPQPSEVISRLGENPPTTISGQLALALAYLETGEKEKAAVLARAIWSENFLDRGTEDRVRTRLGDLLDQDAHWDRAVHLMMHDRAKGVERLMSELNAAQKSLAIARIAVSRNAKDAKKLLDSVDPEMQKHPVFHFSRAQRARQFELWDDAVAWLNKSKGPVPDAAEWWTERRALMHQLLALGKNKLAYRAAAGFRHGPDGRLVEAHFNAGWIALNFLDDAASAQAQFEEMRKHTTLPDTITQANYWLGRAKQARGDKLGANEAFAVAARYGTVYYGQLARAELGMKSVHLRELPEWRDSEQVFENSDAVRAVRLLADNGQSELAAPLLREFAEQLQDGGQLVLAARLAQSLGSHDLAIAIATIAEKRGVPLDLFSFPKDGLPTTRLASIDKAAVYAVTKQESHFRADAVSHAGARGLMQLMPGTAKETAEKTGLKYSPKRLTSDPAYNAFLGSTYLAAQLRRYEGSLVLAAAAYNAGGGNANKWIRANGDPRSADVDPAVWVELIPFQETRKYVQRVLGNYLVYRARLGDEDISLHQALRRIPS